jgi:hypothetical protein
MTDVYLILKNADFTEGRGPMLTHMIVDSFETAHDYIMKQSGIYGSSQGENLSFRGTNYRYYNGYEVKKLPVMTLKDIMHKNEIEHEIKILENKIKELKNAIK